VPESSSELEPYYLGQVPLDIIDGRPLRYRRLDSDDFLLYSIGWNELDDAGHSRNLRDWVWRPRAGAKE